MTREEIIEQLNLTIGLIKQDGKDWLDDRDIPILEKCVKALENHDTFMKYAYSYGKADALSQEPSRDIKEIAEVMKSDVDAETKCKMISNILTAKPHYFEISQEPCDENLHREREQAYMQGYEDASKRFRQEPCEDAVSRKKAIYVISACDGKSAQIEALERLPSVTQKSKTGHWIDTDEWCETVDGFEQWGYFRKCSKCGYVFKFLEIDNYCPNCGCRMFEPQESEEISERNMKMWEGIFKAERTDKE